MAALRRSTPPTTGPAPTDHPPTVPSRGTVGAVSDPDVGAGDGAGPRAARDGRRRRPPRLQDLLDAAITVPSTVARSEVDRLRVRHPSATPAEVVEMLEGRYLLLVQGTGGAVGAAAAFPSIGTGTAVALTSSQVGTFLAASAGLALAVADVHGVEIDNVVHRRTLVLASLLGEQGSVIVEEEVGIGTLFWARSLLTRLPMTTVRSVNRTLAKRVARYGTTRGGVVFLGRLAPFGIGAVIGWTGARAMGGTMIAGVRRAFGPPPEAFTRIASAPGEADLLAGVGAVVGREGVVTVPGSGPGGARGRRERRRDRRPTAPPTEVDVPRV